MTVINCSIDATEETNRMGRLINHSKSKANLSIKVVGSEKGPHLCFFASCDIEAGTELFYDYGDKSKSSIQTFQWLKQ